MTNESTDYAEIVKRLRADCYCGPGGVRCAHETAREAAADAIERLSAQVAEHQKDANRLVEYQKDTFAAFQSATRERDEARAERDNLLNWKQDFEPDYDALMERLQVAIQSAEAAEAEVKRLKERAWEIAKIAMKRGADIRDFKKEVARLREALTKIVQREVSREQFVMQGPAYAARALTAAITIARAALEAKP